jgi:glycosyltransferase involved in cell wall biosynthesis
VRILFVSHHFPPAHTAGTETYAYNLSQRFKERHRIWVFCTEKRIAHPQYKVLEEETDGVPTRILINNLCYNHYGETFSNPGVERAIEEVLDEVRPDVVHIHHLMFTSLNLPMIAKARGIPVVMTLHDFFLICPRGGQLMLAEGSVCPGPSEERCPTCMAFYKYRQSRFENKLISLVGGVKKFIGLDITKPMYLVRDRLFKKDLAKGTASPAPGDRDETLKPILAERRRLVEKLFEAVDLFMSPSRTVGDALEARGLPREKLRLWKYGIDTRPFENLERPRRTRPVFGYLGTLMPHKGVHVFVEAAASLAPGLIEAKVRGSETLNPRYAGKLKELAGSKIIFQPPFGRKDVARAFSEIDVLVLPSLWLENSPVVIQEAFAGRCPVITSDFGGMAELVTDGKDGRLFPVGDAGRLAAILEEAGRDPNLIEKWRAGITPPRTIEDDSESLEALYERLVKGEGLD